MLPDGFVGMEEKKYIICEKLRAVSIVGLVGMCGIGKTTLSMCVYNSQAEFYEETCFLQDVRSRDVASVQKELLQQLCGITLDITECVTLNHLRRIRECITGRKVLMVIDDVENFKTLIDLQVPAFRYGSSGSKVIVTGRNRRVFGNYVSNEGLKKVEIMEVEGLNDAQALQLFRHHAFNGVDCEDDEMKDFKDLTVDIVKACRGLPLSLKVIGRHLGTRDVHSIEMRKGIWEETLGKLQEANLSDGGDDIEILCMKLRTTYED